MSVRVPSRPALPGAPAATPPAPRWRWSARTIAGLALAAGPGGCGPAEALKPVVPAHGAVLLDGKPTRGLLVVFHPTDDPVPNALDPRAVVDADGSFRLSTHNAEDGAPPGRYAVTVHDPRSTPGAEGEPPPSSAAPRLPGRYGDRTRSGLAAEVRADSPNTFEFRLTR